MHPPGRASALAGCRSPLTVGTGIAIGVLVVGLRQSSQGRVNLNTYRFTPLVTEPGVNQLVAWSPDGRSIAYVSGSRILVRSLEADTATTVAQGIRGRPPRCSGFQTAPASVTSQTTECGLSASREATPNACSRARSRARRSPPTATRALWITTSSEGRRTAGLWFASPITSPPKSHEKAFVDSPALSPNLLAWSPDGKRLAYSGFAPIPQCGSCQSRMTARARQCAPSPSTRGVPRRSSRGCRTTNPWSCRRG